jgi:hypothetical protein
MNKYIAISSLVVGLGIFVMGTLVAITVPVRLHVSSSDEIKVQQEYEAPIVGFRGEIVKKKGVAHRVREQRIELPNMTIASGEEEGLQFGQFSTKEAMNYHTIRYRSKVPNLKMVEGDPRHAK